MRTVSQQLNTIPIAGSCVVRALPLLLLLSSAVTLSALQTASGNRIGKPDASLQAAESLLRQGRLDEAKAAVQADLQAQAPSVEAYNLLGIVDTEQQNYQEALAAFQKALQLSPGSVKTLNNLGAFYLAQKKLELAEKEFRAGLRLDPENRDGHYNLGLILMERGEPAEAALQFQRVRPADPDTRLHLIEAELQSKHTAEALATAAALSTENKNDASLHVTLGTLLASHMQNKAALLQFADADALEPGTFEVLYNLGQTYLLDGQYTNADLQLNRALALKPDSPETLYLLAQSDWKEARPLDSLDLLVRAHKLAPENADISLLMAQISMAQGYFADAIPLLLASLESAPQRIDLRSALGEAYFRSDQMTKALEEFQRVVDAQPSVRAYAFLGLTHSSLGRLDAAKQDFQRDLLLDPHSTYCLFNLGYIAERKGDDAAAEAMFQRVLQLDPSFPDALLELANLRLQANRLPDAEELLKRYIALNHNPAPGYYKLAAVERKLHKTADADRDLAQFQALSKAVTPHSYEYEDLFDYLDNRSRLSPLTRDQQDVTDLLEEAKRHPDQPEILYLLAQAYLRSANADGARSTIAQLNEISRGDYRTLAGAGVLLARYHLYDDAVRQFQAALAVNPAADDVQFDLADALFRKGLYAEALETAQKVSNEESRDDAYLALLADIYAHLGDASRAAQIDRDAIERNPDNDQNYLSLALLQLRENDVAGAQRTLSQGQARMPASGKILWGDGLASMMAGNTALAAQQFERAVDLLPEWPGSYSMLGIFYFQTGQITRAREVLDRFRGSNAGGLDVSRIEQVLAAAPLTTAAGSAPLPPEQRQQLLQMALYLVDKTL